MPPTVTWYSCIASSSAACVFGGVRLISSARMMFAKTGPGMNRMCARAGGASSSMTSVPRMSDGIRSGVNWMRLNFRCTASASVLISSVLASPGTPRSRQWPPARNAIRISVHHGVLPDDHLAQFALQRPDQARGLGQGHRFGLGGGIGVEARPRSYRRPRTELRPAPRLAERLIRLLVGLPTLDA